MDLVAGRAFAQERRPIRHVDWFLIVITIALSVVGLLLLYSATSQTLRQGGFDPFDRVNKQAITMVLGAGAALAIASIDYRFLKVYAGFIYLGVGCSRWCSCGCPGIGTTDSTGTAQRWFALGPAPDHALGVHEARDHRHARGGAVANSERRSRRCAISSRCWSWRPCRSSSSSSAPTSARRSGSPRSSSGC